MTLIRRMYEGAATIIAGNVFALLLALINVFLIARFLGPTDFGYLSILLALCGVLLILVDFGSESTIAKFISERRFPIIQTISTIFSLKLGILLIGITIYAIIILFISDYLNLNPLFLKLYLFIVPFLLISESLFRFERGVFQGLKRMGMLALFNIFWRFFQLILCIGLVLAGFGIIGAAMGYGLASLTIFLIGLHYFPKNWFKKPERGIVHSLFKFSFYTSITLSMYTLIYWTDILCVSYFCPPEEVGYYSIGAKIAILVVMIPVAIEAILYPMLSEKYGHRDIASARRLYLSSMRAIFYSAGLVLILLLTFSIRIINILLPAYILSIPVIFVLIFAYFWGTFSSSYASFLNAWNHPEVLAKISIFQAIFNICANIILVPKYGYVSAAFASLVTFIIGTSLGWKAVQRIIGTKITLKNFMVKKEDVEGLKEIINSIKKFLKG